MGSPSSPPVLYLTDDDNENEVEQNIMYSGSLSTMNNDHLPRKKRKLTNTNVRVNSSIVNWSKRQRNDNYEIPQNIINHEREMLVIDSDEYNYEEQRSHSFRAFDWTNEIPTSSRIHPNSFQPASRVSIVPPVSIVKHHLDQSRPMPLISMTHQNDRYIQPLPRKSVHIPINSPSPSLLPLPLPTLTSTLVRPIAQRAVPGKNIRISYTHSVSLNFNRIFFSNYNLLK